MGKKVKAVKKSAEALLAKLTLFPSVRAFGHAEFQTFRLRVLQDADFFKATCLRFSGGTVNQNQEMPSSTIG